MNKTLTEIKKEWLEFLADECFDLDKYKHGKYDLKMWKWIQSTISQTKQELIEQLDDIIELWFAVHDKTTKSFMTDDFRKFVKDKLK